MKNIRMIVVFSFIALLTSCEATKETTSSKEAGTRGRVNTETPRAVNSSTNSRQEAAQKTAASGITANTEALNETRMREMYSALNMNENQITRFQRDWKTSTDSWKRSNRNQAMNNYERVEQQDRILRDILEPSQFEAYQEWTREHSAGN